MFENHHEEQLKSSIARALLYSDIFSYPLTAEEVFLRISTNHTCIEEVGQVLQKMKEHGLVFQFGEYFAIRNEKNLEARRNVGNRRAKAIMPSALRRGKFLAKFPFIRSVMISGSLSKQYMDNDSDVDYFVITAPGRLWIARLFVAIFKRVFLFNSHKLFCVNYYIDDSHLEIEEKNIFTATELITLIPACGGQEYLRLIKSNGWVSEYFPNNNSRSIHAPASEPRSLWLKRVAEALINPAGDLIDSYVLHLATLRYKRHYSHLYSAADFNIAFKSRKDVSKNHRQHFQKHITELLERKVERFHKEHGQPVMA